MSKKKNIPVSVKTELVIADSLVKVGDVVIYSHDEFPSEVLRLEEEGGYKYIVINNHKGYSSEPEDRISEHDFKNYYRLAKGVNISEAQDIADKILSGELPASFLLQKDDSEEVGNQLMVVNADMYLRKREELQIAHNRVEAIKGLIKAKTEAIQSQVRRALAAFQKTITKLNKIIFTLELYAGIAESIKQIQSGEPAGDNEPIYLMQILKFMDEEVGDPSNGGVSYDTTDKFDEWLLSYNKFLGYHNYNLLIPFKKGVRIMRVRRNPSARYSTDPWNNRWNIDQEMETYVIIRNGENLYTISSKMNFSEKLFPAKEELQDFYEKGGDFDSDEKMQQYKHGMVLMQGLADRTEVFGNMFGKISFLKNSSAEEGKVVFFYEDDDKLITDGSMSRLEFLNTSKIEAGDRILLYSVGDTDMTNERIYKQYFDNKYRVPASPDDGIYKLNWDEEYRTLYLRYLPDDEVWSQEKGYHKRTKGFSYKINPSDSFIVNIDMVSHRNINWIKLMLYDRRDRKNYLRAVGLFNSIIKFKEIELAQERPFADLVISSCNATEDEALDAIHWWKTKNKHKRALFVDDVKALRMITKKIKGGRL